MSVGRQKSKEEGECKMKKGEKNVRNSYRYEGVQAGKRR